jgi:ribosomal protein S3
MAQKVNPLAVRLGVNRGADSCWFSDYYYATLLSQDLNLREYLLTVTNRAAGTQGFRPGRCVIHHYPKNSFVHFFWCRLVKTTKRPRSVVPKRKPLYSYDSLRLPSLKHQTAPWANACWVPVAREASLGAFAPIPRPAAHQHTGHASGLRAASTPGATLHGAPGLKHTKYSHILAEVLLAEPGQPADVLSGSLLRPRLARTGAPSGSPWGGPPFGVRLAINGSPQDEPPKPRLEPTSNQPSQRRALNHLSAASLRLQGDQPVFPPQPGWLHQATPLQTTTQYGLPTPRPTGYALGLTLAKLVEARLHEVRCALACNQALPTTTPSECSVVNQRRCNLAAFAPSCLRHKDAAPQPRAVQLAGQNAAMRWNPGDPGTPASPKQTPVLPGPSRSSPGAAAGSAEWTTSSGNVVVPAPAGTQCLTLRGGPWCLWWPESRLALRRISHARCVFKVPTLPRLRTTRTTVAFYEQPQRLLGLWTKASKPAITRTAWDTSDKPPAGGSVPPLAASTVGHPLTPKQRPEGLDLSSVCLTPALVKQLDTMGPADGGPPPSGLNTNTCATSSVAWLGGLLLEEAEPDDGFTAHPFGVSSLPGTSTSAQVSSVLASTARVAQPYIGQTTTKSVWRPPLVSTVHNRLTQQHGPAAVSPNPYGPMSNTPLGLLTQVLTCRMPRAVSPLTSDLNCADVGGQHWLFRNQLCSPRPLATLTPSEASSAHQALCSNTGTKCQMLQFKRLLKPFVLESVPHFPKLLRLSGWTRLAMHQAQAWTMRHKTPKPLSQSRHGASTQAPGDLRIPAAEPAVFRSLAAAGVSRSPDRPDGTLAKGLHAGDAVLGTPSTAIDTAQGSLCQSTTKAQLLPKCGGGGESWGDDSPKGSSGPPARRATPFPFRRGIDRQPLGGGEPPRSSRTLSPFHQGLNHVVGPAAGEPSGQDTAANQHHLDVTPGRLHCALATGVFGVSADKTTKGWLTHSGLQYYVMHYFSLCKTNRSCGDVHGHVQHVQRHVKEALYLELPLNQSSHYLLSNIQSRIESHTGTFTSILPIKQSSVGYQTAYLVAQEISFQLEQKKSFRQICRSILKQMDLCQYIIKGIRIKCSGRLNGAEMAKTECRKYGETSLNVFSEPIDYAHTKASTPYGILGVKVWIAYVSNDTTSYAGLRTTKRQTAGLWHGLTPRTGPSRATAGPPPPGSGA